MHIAARARHLDQIPSELLTPEMLSLSGGEGCPIHTAARWGSIDQLPAGLVAELKNLPDMQGNTPSQCAEEHQRLLAAFHEPLQ